MTSDEYLKFAMNRLSTLLFNASQSNNVTKDTVLDSIKSMLEDYQRASGNDARIDDFRDRRR